jgi:hydrogenase maturation protease
MKQGLLVIGCGNLLASDDGVGIEIVRRLQEMELPQGVKIVEAGTPGLQLLDIWEKAEQVIIVDAVRSGEPVGTVHCFDATLLPPREFMPLSSHGINVIDAIELGKLLGKNPPELRIVGVEILSSEPYNEGLTPQVAMAVPRAIQRLLLEIEHMIAS